MLQHISAFSPRKGRAGFVTFAMVLVAGLAPPRVVVTAVDHLCHPQGYLWWVRGKTLLFRKRDWYKQRQYEVPDPWLIALCGTISAQHGAATYRSFFGLSDLAPRQIIGLVSLKFRQQPAGLLNIGEIGEEDLLGWREGLALAKDLFGEGNGPILPYGQEDASLRVVSSTSATANQRQLLQAINEQVAKPFDLDSNDRLDVRLYHDGARLRSDGVVEPNDFFEVTLRMDTSPKGSGWSYRTIPFPTKLPDDRRDRTKVTVGL